MENLSHRVPVGRPDLYRVLPAASLSFDRHRATQCVRRAIPNHSGQGDLRPVAGERGLNMIAARLSPGVISESSSSHLPPSEASKVANPVMLALPQSHRSPAVFIVGNGNAHLQMSEHRPFCSGMVGRRPLRGG